MRACLALFAFGLLGSWAVGQDVQSRYFGAAGCAAGNCHGGQPTESSVRGAEYSIWALRDPHAKAFSALYNARSRAIAKRLWPGENRFAHKEATCLACHSLDAAPERVVEGRQDFVKSAGVSCEACHGPAEAWLQAHYRHDFRQVDPSWETTLRKEDFAARFEESEALQEKFGLVNNLNLKERGQQCVRCHVGPSFGYEVNHDLIAAGHPRLTFEYAAYMAHLPPHWNATAERAVQPFHDARLWALGRAITAEQALKLLAVRADPDAKLNKQPPAWPEFTEYDCYACHHAIGETDRVGFRGPGRLRWGTWNTGLLTDADGADLKLFEADPLVEVRRTLNAGIPDRVEVLKMLATRKGEFVSPEVLAQGITELNNDPAREHPGFTADSIRGLVQTIVSRGATTKTASWDVWTQHFLAVHALHGSLVRTVGAEQAGVDAQRIDAVLDELRNSLSFPRGFESPRRLDHAAIQAEFVKLRDLYEGR